MFVLSLVGCTSFTPGPRKTTAAQPAAGKATVVGRVTTTSGAPITDTPVRLSEVYRGENQSPEGIFVLDGAQSPGAMTSEDGQFVIADVEAREYVLVVGDVQGEHTIIVDEAGKARVWNAEPDKVLDVGELKIDKTNG